MDFKKHQNKNERNIFIFLIKYSYILFTLYIIITIISIYTALHCNDLFSFETLFATIVPYIYLPFRYYFKNYCKLPNKICFA